MGALLVILDAVEDGISNFPMFRTQLACVGFFSFSSFLTAGFSHYRLVTTPCFMKSSPV